MLNCFKLDLLWSIINNTISLLIFFSRRVKNIQSKNRNIDQCYPTAEHFPPLIMSSLSLFLTFASSDSCAGLFTPPFSFFLVKSQVIRVPHYRQPTTWFQLSSNLVLGLVFLIRFSTRSFFSLFRQLSVIESQRVALVRFVFVWFVFGLSSLARLHVPRTWLPHVSFPSPQTRVFPNKYICPAGPRFGS